MNDVQRYAQERTAGEMVPLTAQVTEYIGQTRQGALVTAFALDGTAFEAKTPEQRSAYKDALNVWLRNIASPRLGLWSVLLRRRFVPDLHRIYDNAFAQQVNDRYAALQSERPLYVNRLYLVLVLRVLGLRPVVPWSRDKDQAMLRDLVFGGIEELDDLSARTLTGLADYGPSRLGIYDNGHNRFSELAELYGDILNGEGSPVPVGPYDLSQAVGRNRLLFGREVFEVRTPSKSRYGACLGIKEYVSATYPEMFEPLLSLNVEYSWVQSFLYQDKETVKGLFSAQRRRMVSAGDEAVSQIQALHEASDQLLSNFFVGGSHQASLIVYSDTAAALQDNVALAQSALSDPGFVVVREDLALQGGVFSALPGCVSLRPRAAVVTSLNFASFSPFYCYPMGRQHGHHWGEAVTLFRSVVDTPVWFSPHVGDLGHTTVIGMSGAGKTALLAFLLGQLQRFPARHFILDKDQGLKLAILAYGGEYKSMKYGEPTGMNPFDRPMTDRHAAFLHDLVRLLTGDPWSAKASKEVDEAIKSVYGLDAEQRRLGALLHFLDPTDEEGVAARLRPWVDGGRYAWCFDAGRDTLELGRLTGVDVTEFLEDAAVRTPLSAYLLYRTEALIDGSPFAIWIDEFWRLLDDPFFESFVRDSLKTIRKKDGIVITATQSPADALNSRISAAILEQSPTKIFLPNEYASEKDYCDGFKLTPAEWAMFAPMTKSIRCFLLKQGGTSTLINFDLQGMEREMRILSGTERRIVAAERMAAAHGGTLPHDWLSLLEAETGT
jgi:type IV secretion system protein VirB4